MGIAALPEAAPATTGLADALFTSVQQRVLGLLFGQPAMLWAAATLAILRRQRASVYDVALGLFGTMTDFHLVLGCAEANAHLELLEDRGLVSDEGGVFRHIE